MAKIGLATGVFRNIGCFELPCWVPLGELTPDLAPLRLPEFAALVERHEEGGDIAHVVEDWLTDHGLSVVAASWRRLVNEGKGHRLRDYINGLANLRAGGAVMVYSDTDPVPTARELGAKMAMDQNRRFWKAFVGTIEGKAGE